MAGGTPFDFREFLTERLEQGISSLRNAAAEDDGLGVENVDERREGAREGMNGLKPDISCESIAGAIGAAGESISGEPRANERQ